MSEYDFENEDIDTTIDDESGEPAKDSRQFVRKLEQEAKAGKAAKREAEEAQREAANAKRELAFLKAGIDLESPTGKLFAKAYDGDTSLEAVRTAASEYGLIPTSQTDEVKNDLDALNRVSQASAGSTGVITPTALDAIRGASDPAAILKVLQDNGIAISDEQPGGWVSLV